MCVTAVGGVIAHECLGAAFVGLLGHAVGVGVQLGLVCGELLYVFQRSQRSGSGRPD